jgi:copper homeostasis protein
LWRAFEKYFLVEKNVDVDWHGIVKMPTPKPIQPQENPNELEVIACSLQDAMEAYRGGASRLEVTIRLDHAGLTPPFEMVRQILESVPLAIRVMLRDRRDFLVGGSEELAILARKAREFVALKAGKNRKGGIEGLVTGHVKNGRLDLAALEKITSAAPKLRVTVHHAIEATADPVMTLRTFRNFPNVDRALVSGGAGSLEKRIERLVQLRDAFGSQRSLIAGGNVTLEMIRPLRDATGIRIFHLGRAVRTPEESLGQVDSKKVRMAVDLLGMT